MEREVWIVLRDTEIAGVAVPAGSAVVLDPSRNPEVAAVLPLYRARRATMLALELHGIAERRRERVIGPASDYVPARPPLRLVTARPERDHQLRREDE